MNTKDKRTGRAPSAQSLIWGAAVLLLVLFGCQSPTSSTPAVAAPYTTYLYMTDSTSGKVYAYDPATHTSKSPSLLTTAGSAGEIKFYKGIGYVAVGYGSTAGVYYFDPSVAVPAATLIPGSANLNAEYFAFASSTVAYFSVATDYTADSGAIYSFNPSNPSTGVTRIATSVNKYMQEIVIGSDGMLYGAENLDQKVVRINPATNLVTPIAMTKSGTTGLFAGTFGGSAGIFVANTGGSLDFIANSGTTATTVATNGSVAFYPGRVVQLSNGDLIATGFDPSYMHHTYYVKASASPVTVSEIQYNGTSFGSLSLVSNGTTVYVPSTTSAPVTNSLYTITTTGSPAASASYSVMTSTDAIANVAFYQN